MSPQKSGLPDQGPVCERCGLVIPQFPELSPEDEHRIRQLMRDGNQLLAVRALVKATGTPLASAKVWVQHDGRTQPRAPGTTCTYCGGRLRSPRAQQCLECGMDWHDPDRPKKLGATAESRSMPDMESDRELLLAIRDQLAEHANRHADWLAHQREREAKIDADMASALEQQRAQGRFYKLVVLVGLPIFAIICLSVFASSR